MHLARKSLCALKWRFEEEVWPAFLFKVCEKSRSTPGALNRPSRTVYLRFQSGALTSSKTKNRKGLKLTLFEALGDLTRFSVFMPAKRQAFSKDFSFNAI